MGIIQEEYKKLGNTLVEKIDKRVEEIIRFKYVGEHKNNYREGRNMLMDGINSVLFAPADSKSAEAFVLSLRLMYDEEKNYYFIKEGSTEDETEDAYILLAHARSELETIKEGNDEKSLLSEELIKELRKYTVLRVKLEELKYKLKYIESRRSKII